MPTTATSSYTFHNFTGGAAPTYKGLSFSNLSVNEFDTYTVPGTVVSFTGFFDGSSPGPGTYAGINYSANGASWDGLQWANVNGAGVKAPGATQELDFT